MEERTKKEASSKQPPVKTKSAIRRSAEGKAEAVADVPPKKQAAPESKKEDMKPQRRRRQQRRSAKDANEKEPVVQKVKDKVVEAPKSERPRSEKERRPSERVRKAREDGPSSKPSDFKDKSKGLDEREKKSQPVRRRPF